MIIHIVRLLDAEYLKILEKEKPKKPPPVKGK